MARAIARILCFCSCSVRTVARCFSSSIDELLLSYIEKHIDIRLGLQHTSAYFLALLGQKLLGQTFF
jgi:hypothetical protein